MNKANNEKEIDQQEDWTQLANTIYSIFFINTDFMGPDKSKIIFVSI